MNRFRTKVLQDLSHALPPKGSQVSNSYLHTTPSNRRFWSFFEFSSKESSCNESKKCPSSKNIVSPPPISANEFGDAAKCPMSLARPVAMTSTITLNPKTAPSHTYKFEVNTIPDTKLRIKRSFVNEDDLTSLLDGNPVPKTLKWKLTGYKTLRNEQAGDFAFVPGGKNYDFDIITRTETHPSRVKTINSIKTMENAIAKDRGKSTLPLENKRLENEVKIQDQFPMKPEFEGKNVDGKKDPMEIATEKNQDDGSILVESSSLKLKNVDCTTGVEVKSEIARNRSLIPRPVTNLMVTSGKKNQLKLLADNLGMKADMKYLPMPKAEVVASATTCQVQSVVQFSSRSPKNVPKPSTPSFPQKTETSSASKKPTPSSIQSSNNHETLQTSSDTPQTTPPTNTEIQQNAYKWSSMKNDPENKNTSMKPNSSNVRSTDTNSSYNEKPEMDRSTTYFAPRASKPTPSYGFLKTTENSSLPEKSQDPQTGYTYSRVLNITNNYQQRVKNTPCAASLARSLEGQGSAGHQSSSYGLGNSSMAGNSGNGSRKPPNPYPISTPRRTSSSKSYNILRKPLTALRDSPQRMKLNNSKVNISTTVPRRKCNEEETEGKTICTKPRQRKCQRENSCRQENTCRQESTCGQSNRCQKPPKKKQKCKRYCCPELQEVLDCGHDEKHCTQERKCGQERQRGRERRTCQNNARDKCEGRSNVRQREDPSCLPNKNHKDCSGMRKSNNRNNRDCGGGRQICTDPSRRRNDCGNNNRECNNDRRNNRSCNRNNQSCRGNRNQGRSCNREENCSRRSNSCNRGNDCQKSSNGNCNRSASCTGRRNFSQSACTLNRSQSCTVIRRVSSVSTLTVTLPGAKVRENETEGRFYGTSCDKKKPPSCKKSECDKSTKKCKKGPANCLPRKSSGTSCKSEQPKSCQSTCKKETSKCNSSSEKSDGMSCAERRKSLCNAKKSGKSKSDEYCSKKLAEDKKGSEEESIKARVDRERKEMKECTKGLRGKSKDRKKEEKEAKPTGLERVISPCKQRQQKTGSPCKKTDVKCPTKFSSLPMLGIASLNSFIAFDSLLFPRQSIEAINGDRTYSTMRIDRINYSCHDDCDTDRRNDNGRDFWTFNEDDFEYNDIPLPILIENPENDCEECSSRHNWLFSWLKRIACR